MHGASSALLVAAVVALALHTSSASRDFPFWNPNLPWDVRVNDLVSRLTLEEIQSQMARGGAGKNGGPAPAIPRLGIQPYQWDTECIDGDVQAPGVATGFPASIGLSASFSHQLVYDVATASARETRGKHNVFVKRGIFDTHTGASCFSPVVNIARDPRWGRNQETYGEDPLMSGQLGSQFVWGLQGNHSRFVRTSAGCKHFDAHGGPENIPVSRFSFNAIVTDADWHMTYLPAFRQCVDAGTYSVMCSYNRINGVPACANGKLLTDILRKEWGFKGYVVSDEAAIENIITQHKYLNTSVDTAAACVNAGCNLELSQNLSKPVYMHIVEAVKQGKLSEEMVRERVKPLFYTRMRLGEFDPAQTNPFAALGEEQVESPAHRALAITAAMKSYVLLKNEGGLLPLREGQFKKVSIVGPMADNWSQLFSDYPAFQPRKYTKTPLDALREEFPDIRHGKACVDGNHCKQYQANVVPEVVDVSDLVFVALGTGKDVEAEFNDRPDVNLPGHQKDLLLDAIEYSGNAKIVLLLFNAGPLNVTFADESERVAAILECFIPGQGAGQALVNVLFNKGHNSTPAGRLSMTWPRYAWQIPAMVNYSMSGRTYRYLDTEPLYPFGYGLSYSKFKYSNLKVAPSHKSHEDLQASVVVTNVGRVDSDEVIQCYIGPKDPQPYPSPRHSLGFFLRTHLMPEETRQVNVRLPRETWAVWRDGRWTYPALPMTLTCGGGQPGQRKASTVSAVVNFQA